MGGSLSYFPAKARDLKPKERGASGFCLRADRYLKPFRKVWNSGLMPFKPHGLLGLSASGLKAFWVEGFRAQGL